jgi:acetylornithine deacetylase/succinyl-diaminopimelate desuccinylase-like protein
MAAQSTADILEMLTPGLSKFVRSEHCSPAYDKEFFKNGKIASIGRIMVEWANSLKIPDFTCELLEERGKSPLIFAVAPGSLDGTILMNFHFDKLPPVGKWTSDPREMVERDGWL